MKTPSNFSTVEDIRNVFPILKRKVKEKPLVYFDNAASTQKPESVIRTVSEYYSNYNANVHRGIHTLSEEATEAMELSRKKIASFIGASSWREIVFTKGTTESINLVAHSLGLERLRTGDEVIITTLEHHANIVPWQLLQERIGIKIKIIPIKDEGTFKLEDVEKLWSTRTKLISIVHTSNSLGTRNPVEEVCKWVKQKGILVLLDAAQAIAHETIDVKKLDCDFLVFSSHKIFGPTGVGVLYAKEAILETLPPYQGGGEMIDEVSFEGSTWNSIPFKFEAGTPNIAGNIGLGTALDFVESIGFDFIKKHEQKLLQVAIKSMQNIDGVKLIGTAPVKAPIVSFIVEGIHHQDLALLLDAAGVAVRTGHHCTQPLMKRLGLTGTTRASFSIYNTEEEIAYFVAHLERIIKMLR